MGASGGPEVEGTNRRPAWKEEKVKEEGKIAWESWDTQARICHSWKVFHFFMLWVSFEMSLFRLSMPCS
jgi:hypothetical protein